jgi:ATP-dependent helicase HrpB
MSSVPGLIPLPIDASLDAIRAAVRADRAAVITAAPGAGKTTRVPPALVADGPVLVLQPRRVAARAIARRIANEQGWTLGREVGWHVRFERNFSSSTSLLVATEGILTARLQQDPMASEWRTIVIDEFHERSLHADVGLALAREAWRARDDLRLVVMSATLDVARVSAYLDNCPVIEVPGRTYPLEVTYAAATPVEQAVAQAAGDAGGAVLVFLPGAPEIRRVADRVASFVGANVPVLPLHGGLTADEQDAALQPTGGTRIVLATNLAETTLTVPDVTVVIDTGLHKVSRHDPGRGIDSLETERVTQDSADQRAGRAGRVRAGRVVRLWDARDRLRPHREPEIARVDLAAVVLDVLGWGGDPRTLGWFDPPPAHALDSAFVLLERLGAIDLDAASRLTSIGRTLQRLPIHPRLGRMLVAGHASPLIARACALLAERHVRVPGRAAATSCDLLSALDGQGGPLPAHIERVAREIERVAKEAIDQGRRQKAEGRKTSEEEFRRAVLAGYPDRVARRRASGSDRFLMANGSGARLGRESGVINAEFIVAVDVAGAATGSAEAMIRIATAIEPEWIAHLGLETRVTHAFDASRGAVSSARVQYLGAMPVSEHAIAPDPLEAGPLIAKAYGDRGPAEGDRDLLQRLEFAGVSVSFDELVARASAGTMRLSDVDLAGALTAAESKALRDLAPASIDVPSGRQVKLEYRSGGAVVAAVKLQELFGLGDSPRVGRARVPVTFELLSPAGRPVQVTNDLRSFWTRGYPEVRKELRARYPKHPWPEDPWSAPASARPIRRKTD